MAEVKSQFLSVSPYLGPPTITGVKTFTTFIYSLAPPPGTNAFDYWATYMTGDIVADSNALWISLADNNTENTPLFSPTFWEVWSGFQVYNATTGFLSGVNDVDYLPRVPTHVLGTDGQTLYPVLSRSLDGLWLSTGLVQSAVATIVVAIGEGVSITGHSRLIFNYDPGYVVDLAAEGIFLTGQNLYADGLLTLVNPTGTLLNDMVNSFNDVAGTEGGILINGIGTACVPPLPPMPTGSGDVVVALLTATQVDDYAVKNHTRHQSQILRDGFAYYSIWRVLGSPTWSSGNLGTPFVSGPYEEGFSCPTNDDGFFLDAYNFLSATVPTPGATPDYTQDNWLVTIVAKAPATLTDGQVLMTHGVEASGTMSGSGWVCYLSGSKMRLDVAVGDASGRAVASVTSSNLSANDLFIVSFGRFQSGAIQYVTPPEIVNSTGTMWAGGTSSYFIKLNNDVTSSIRVTGSMVIPDAVSSSPWTATLWDEFTSYYGDKTVVEFSGAYYSSLQTDNLGNFPDVSPSWWESWPSKYPPFSEGAQVAGDLGPYYMPNNTAYVSGNAYYCRRQLELYPGPVNRDWSTSVAYKTGSAVRFYGSATASAPYQGWHTYVCISGSPTSTNKIPLIATGSQSGTVNTMWRPWDMSPLNLTASQYWGIIGDNHNPHLGRYEDPGHPFFKSWTGQIYEMQSLSENNPSGSYLGMYPTNAFLDGVHQHALSASAQAGRGAYIAYTSFAKFEYIDNNGPITYTPGTGEISLDPLDGAFGNPSKVIGNGLSFLPVVTQSDAQTITITASLTDAEVFWGNNAPRTLITVESNRGDGGITTYSPFLLFSAPPTISQIDVDGGGYVAFDSGQTYTIVPGTWVYLRGWFGGQVNDATLWVNRQTTTTFVTTETYTARNGFFEAVDAQTVRFMIPEANGQPNGFPNWGNSINYSYHDFAYGPYTTPGGTGNRYFHCMIPNTNLYPQERVFLGWGTDNSYKWLSAPDRAQGFVFTSFPVIEVAGVYIYITDPW
jgi:hypothetical protein